MNIQIEITGNRGIVKTAPIDKLQEVLQEVLQKTTVSSCRVTLVRRVRSRAASGITVKHVVAKGVQVLIQGDTSEKMNYRCVIASDSHKPDALRKELLAAVGTTEDVAAVESKKPRRSHHKKSQKIRIGAGREKLSLVDKGNWPAIISSIAHSMKSGPADSEKITAGFVKDFGIEGSKRWLGGTYRHLRKYGLIMAIDLTSNPVLYELTGTARMMLAGGALLKSGTAVERAARPVTQPKQPVVKLSSLQKRVAALEADDALLESLQEEIKHIEQTLEAKRQQVQDIQARIGMLSQVRDILFGGTPKAAPSAVDVPSAPPGTSNTPSTPPSAPNPVVGIP